MLWWEIKNDLPKLGRTTAGQPWRVFDMGYCWFTGDCGRSIITPPGSGGEYQVLPGEKRMRVVAGRGSAQFLILKRG